MAYLGTPIDTTNQFQSLQGKRFSGDGSTTAFTLDIAPSSVFDIEVFVENVRQDPNSAYGISGTTLTFTGAPPSGTNNIYVIHQAKAVGTIEVLDSAITTAKLGADAVTEAKIADDAVESEHLNDNIISGQTALAATPADTDEFLISDAGTLKRIDYSYLKAANTPSFFAYVDTNQSVSASSNTKVQFDGELFDSDNCYDSTTNYRFTPTEAGKYFLFAQAFFAINSTGSEGAIRIYKNGTSGLQYFARSTYVGGPANQTANIQGIVDANGSSDFFEIYIDVGGNSTLRDDTNQYRNWFGGYKIIGA